MNKLWVAFVVVIIAFAIYIVINERKANIEVEPDLYAIIEAKNDTIKMYEQRIDSLLNAKNQKVKNWKRKKQDNEKNINNIVPTSAEIDSFFAKRYGSIVSRYDSAKAAND